MITKQRIRDAKQQLQSAGQRAKLVLLADMVGLENPYSFQDRVLALHKEQLGVATTKLTVEQLEQIYKGTGQTTFMLLEATLAALEGRAVAIVACTRLHGQEMTRRVRDWLMRLDGDPERVHAPMSHQEYEHDKSTPFDGRLYYVDHYRP